MTFTHRLTTEDLAYAEDHSNGYGYFGHTYRNWKRDTDADILEVSNGLGLNSTDLWLWADSRPARHFMDSTAGLPADAFRRELAVSISRELPALRAEHANN